MLRGEKGGEFDKLSLPLLRCSLSRASVLGEGREGKSDSSVSLVSNDASALDLASVGVLGGAVKPSNPPERGVDGAAVDGGGANKPARLGDDLSTGDSGGGLRRPVDASAGGPKRPDPTVDGCLWVGLAPGGVNNPESDAEGGLGGSLLGGLNIPNRLSSGLGEFDKGGAKRPGRVLVVDALGLTAAG